MSGKQDEQRSEFKGVAERAKIADLVRRRERALSRDRYELANRLNAEIVRLKAGL